MEDGERAPLERTMQHPSRDSVAAGVSERAPLPWISGGKEGRYNREADGRERNGGTRPKIVKTKCRGARWQHCEGLEWDGGLTRIIMTHVHNNMDGC